MFITVRELLKLDVLRNATLLAGTSGMERQIRRVTVAEVPDIANWVRGGELILTSGFALKQDKQAQREFVERMALAGVAAIAVKAERFLGRISEGMIRQADIDGIPLIQVPAELPWTDISGAVHDRLLDTQVMILKRSEEVHRALTRKVLDAGGSSLQAVVSTLSDLIGHPVIIEGRNLEFIAGVAADGAPIDPEGSERLEGEEEKRRHLLDRLSGFNGPVRIPEPLYDRISSSRVIMPIRVRGRCYGYISILEDKTPFPDTDHIALEHAATAAALEMVRQDAVAETERRMRRDFWDELLSGNVQNVESIAGRAEALGCNIRHSYVTVVFMPEGGDEGEGPESRPMAVTAQEIMDRWPGSTVPIVLDRNDSIVVLYPVMGEYRQDLLRQDLMTLRERLERDLPGIELSSGVGGYYEDILNIYRSHLESRKALQMGRRLHGAGRDAFYDDMGGYRLLYNYPDRNKVLTFMRETLGSVIDYDERHRAELLKTLKVYFACGESIKLAAGRLFIHRHTLEYRLGQILSLTGSDLKSPEDQIRLRMALAIHDLLVD